MLGLRNEEFVPCVGLVDAIWPQHSSTQKISAMTPYNHRLTALVKRRAEDMLVRDFSPNTIDSYTYQVDKCALRPD